MTRTARILAGLAAVWYVNAAVFMLSQFGGDGASAVAMCLLLAGVAVVAAMRKRHYALVAFAASIFTFVAIESIGPLVAPSALLLWLAAIVTARTGFPQMIVAMALVALFILGAANYPRSGQLWSQFLFGCVTAAFYMPPLWAVGLGAGWAKRRRGVAEARRASDAESTTDAQPDSTAG